MFIQHLLYIWYKSMTRIGCCCFPCCFQTCLVENVFYHLYLAGLRKVPKVPKIGEGCHTIYFGSFLLPPMYSDRTSRIGTCLVLSIMNKNPVSHWLLWHLLPAQFADFVCPLASRLDVGGWDGAMPSPATPLATSPCGRYCAKYLFWVQNGSLLSSR